MPFFPFPYWNPALSACVLTLIPIGMLLLQSPRDEPHQHETVPTSAVAPAAATPTHATTSSPSADLMVRFLLSRPEEYIGATVTRLLPGYGVVDQQVQDWTGLGLTRILAGVFLALHLAHFLRRLGRYLHDHLLRPWFTASVFVARSDPVYPLILRAIAQHALSKQCGHRHLHYFCTDWAEKSYLWHCQPRLATPVWLFYNYTLIMAQERKLSSLGPDMGGYFPQDTPLPASFSITDDGLLLVAFGLDPSVAPIEKFIMDSTTRQNANTIGASPSPQKEDNDEESWQAVNRRPSDMSAFSKIPVSPRKTVRIATNEEHPAAEPTKPGSPSSFTTAERTPRASPTMPKQLADQGNNSTVIDGAEEGEGQPSTSNAGAWENLPAAPVVAAMTAAAEEDRLTIDPRYVVDLER